MLPLGPKPLLLEPQQQAQPQGHAAVPTLRWDLGHHHIVAGGDGAATIATGDAALDLALASPATAAAAAVTRLLAADLPPTGSELPASPSMAAVPATAQPNVAGPAALSFGLRPGSSAEALLSLNSGELRKIYQGYLSSQKRLLGGATTAANATLQLPAWLQFGTDFDLLSATGTSTTSFKSCLSKTALLGTFRAAIRWQAIARARDCSGPPPPPAGARPADGLTFAGFVAAVGGLSAELEHRGGGSGGCGVPQRRDVETTAAADSAKAATGSMGGMIGLLGRLDNSAGQSDFFKRSGITLGVRFRLQDSASGRGQGSPARPTNITNISASHRMWQTSPSKGRQSSSPSKSTGRRVRSPTKSGARGKTPTKRSVKGGELGTKASRGSRVAEPQRRNKTPTKPRAKAGAENANKNERLGTRGTGDGHRHTHRDLASILAEFDWDEPV